MNNSDKPSDRLNLERDLVTTSADIAVLRECREKYIMDFEEYLLRLSHVKHLFPLPVRRSTFEGCEPFEL
jgi:hypothetical protein